MPASPVYAFESGCHINVDRNTKEIRQQDGFISSLVTFTFILPLAFSVIVSHWITLNKQTHEVDSASVNLMTLTFMIIAIVIMLILRFSSHAERLYAETGEEQSDISQSTVSQAAQLWLTFEQLWNILQWVFWRIIRGALPLIGLVLFYGISIIHPIFRIAANCTCLDTFRECQLLKLYTTDIAYNCVKILFMGVLMLFSIFFKKRVLLRCCVTHFCLIFIMTAAATLWLDISIYDARTISVSTRETLINKCRPLNSSLSKYINWKCVNENTDLFETVQRMSPYFYPVNIEFLLLCIEILIPLFFTMKSDDVIQSLKETGRRISGQENLNQDSENEGRDDSAAAEGSQSVTGASSRPRVRPADVDESLSSESSTEPEQDNDDPSAPLLGSDQDGSVSYGTTRGNQPGNGNTMQVGGDNEAIVRMGRAPNTREKSFAVWCLIAIIMNVSLIVFGALTYLKKSHDTWNDIYQIAKIIYWIPLLSALGVAYSTLPDMGSAFFEYSGLELMVVFSIFGFALNVFFSLIAAVSVIGGSIPIVNANTNDTTLPWYDIFEYPKSYIPRLVIADKMLNIIQVFFQSNLLLHAARVKRRTGMESSPKYRRFCVAMMYLAFCNLVLWGTDSFVEMKNICLVPTEDLYFGEDAWHLINHLTGPFILFYRFNCGISFMEVLLTFKYS